MKRAEKLRELRQRSIEELRARDRELRAQLFALRLQRSLGQLEKPSRFREIRHERAQVLTVLREKEHAAGGTIG
jgi:large subunit ribosomal protein L29